MRSRALIQSLLLFAAMISAALTVAGCNSSSQTQDSLAPFVTALKNSGEPILYEGLPHQNMERETFAAELESKQSVELHGFVFYKEPLELKNGDARYLVELLVAANTFQKYRGSKNCGGFHPDYCVEWRSGDDVYRVLICFGCGEAKWYGPAGEVYVDIERDAENKLTTLLKPYVMNRPPVSPV